MNRVGCDICKHETHAAGQCKRCNCGESEIIHSRGHVVMINGDFGDYVNKIYQRPTVVFRERHYRTQ